MLVLARKLDESVVFVLPDGREGRLTVLSIERGKIRLGINFPSDVKIWRQELLPIVDRVSLNPAEFEFE